MGRHTILLVEDDHGVREHAAVVLLDLMLPKLSGLQVLERLQQAGGAAPPVVAMSASHAHLSQAAMVGADATLAKPFDLATLLDTIARYCPPQSDLPGLVDPAVGR